MTGHKRRPGYWQYYKSYRKNDPDFLRRVTLALIMANPHPAEEKRSNRGRKPAHSRAKMDFLCLVKTARHLSFRDVLGELGHPGDVWGESKPLGTARVTL